MGAQGFEIVRADMVNDEGQWNAASAALGRAATKAGTVDTVAFGSFAAILKDKYETPAGAARDFFKAGETQLAAVATTIANNSGQYTSDDSGAKGNVGRAGQGGSGSDAGPGGAEGGKDKGHYAELMSANPMPTDPKDPEVTFDRSVNPETGEVTWTQREMKPGEAVATDGRDVERIPQRADKVVVTMVNGEPQITYVDSDAAPVGGKGSGEATWEAAPVADQTAARVVAGSGAVEPGPHLQTQPQPQPQPQTEWTRPLPEGADYAVVEVRDGQPHLVFLDVEGGQVTEIADHGLQQQPDVRDSAPQQTQEA